jgi:hypothetical protein
MMRFVPFLPFRAAEFWITMFLFHFVWGFFRECVLMRPVHFAILG